MEDSKDLRDRLEKARRQISQKRGRKPTEQELADVLEISLDDVRNLIDAGEVPPLELDEGTSESVRLLLEQAPDLLKSLSAMERALLRMSLGLEDGQRRSSSELSKLFGVSPKSISKVQRKAIHKLKLASG